MTKQPCLKVLVIFILGIILGRYFYIPFCYAFPILIVSFLLSFFFDIFLALTIFISGFVLAMSDYSITIGQFAAKEYIQSLYVYYLPEMEASLISGIVLGGGQDIPREVQQMFRDTGTVHILAVSGLNVGLIGTVCFLIIVNILRLPKKMAVVPSILIVWFYAITTGLNPPVVRSAITLTLLFIGYVVVEREGDILNSLALAALIILLFNPLTLFSISFQLSFVCVLSMILIYPELENFIVSRRGDPVGRPLGRGIASPLLCLFLLSLAIQIGIWPITAFYFQQVSLISVIANIFVVPLVSIILYLGVTMVIFSKVGFLMKILANTSWFCLIILERIVLFFSKLPYSNFHIKSPGLSFVLCYYITLAMILVIRRGAFR